MCLVTLIATISLCQSVVQSFHAHFIWEIVHACAVQCEIVIHKLKEVGNIEGGVLKQSETLDDAQPTGQISGMQVLSGNQPMLPSLIAYS